MTITYTPLFHIAKADEDTPLKDLATVSQQVADTVEAALAAGPASPPGATDLFAVAARVTKLEIDPQVFTDTPAGQTIASGATATVHPARTIDPAALFGAGVGALVMLSAHCMVDAGVAAGTGSGGDFTLMSSASATASYLMAKMHSASYRDVRFTFGVDYFDLIPAGQVRRYYTTLLAKSASQAVVSGQAAGSQGAYNHARYLVLPYV